jgi:hypothetical protein
MGFILLWMGKWRIGPLLRVESCGCMARCIRMLFLRIILYSVSLKRGIRGRIERSRNSDCVMKLSDWSSNDVSVEKDSKFFMRRNIFI